MQVKQKLDLLRKHFSKEELDKLVVLESFMRVQNHNQLLVAMQLAQEMQSLSSLEPEASELLADSN